MAVPTPLRALIGGIGIPVAAHELLLLNGNVFGISGFIHRAVRGSTEGFAGAAGLILGGILVAQLEGRGPASLSLSLPKVVISGFLVGLGTKLANGCTSGHMICGVSRLSLRSIVATATFFTAGVLTTQAMHQDIPAVGPIDWSFKTEDAKYLLLQAIPLTLFLVLYRSPGSKSDGNEEDNHKSKALRVFGFLATSFQFALALRLSNLSEASRVLSFLLLPIHRGFDLSLALVAVGALSLGIPLYHYARGNENPRLGGKWSVPRGGKVDPKLLIGSTIFGIGWGMAGICPGPGLVNFGRAVGSGGDALLGYAAWLSSMVAGGLLL